MISTLFTTFKAFTKIKQIGIIIALLLTLWGSFKVAVIVHDRGVIAEKVKKDTEDFNQFRMDDIDNVRKTDKIIDSTDRDTRNQQLCGGPCETSTSSSVPGRVETNPSIGPGQTISAEDVRNFIKRYPEEQRESKGVFEEMSTGCTEDQVRQCDLFPSCCLESN